MAFSLPAAGISLVRANFAEPLTTFVNGLESSLATATSNISTLTSSVAAKYTKPAQGIPLSDLSSTALGGLVQNGGGVTRAVALTTDAYNALATKDATTLYLITG